MDDGCHVLTEETQQGPFFLLRLSNLSQRHSRGLPGERASPLHSGAPLECRSC
jgi:hypothetical protein